MRRHLLVILFVLFLASCGSSDSNNTMQETIDPCVGMWTGSTSNGRSLFGVVLDDGYYYFIYSSQLDQHNIVGFIQGYVTIQDGRFVSSNVRDFNFEGYGVMSGTLKVTARQKKSLSGSLSYIGGGTNTFECSYNPDFESTASLSEIVGSFNGNVAVEDETQSASITIDEYGSFSGIGNGCSFSGDVYPESNSNVFNSTLLFGSSPCFYPDRTFYGICYFDPSTNEIYAVYHNGRRDTGFIFIGDKLLETKQ